MEASVSAEPVRTIPPDAPIFAPLRWGMTRDHTRRALTSDSWRRDAALGTSDADWFHGRMFAHDALLTAKRTSAGRLAYVSLGITDEQTFTWDRSLWTTVTDVLRDGYGEPSSSSSAAARASGGATYCSSFGNGGSEVVEMSWETVRVSMSGDCMVIVSYLGPGIFEDARTEVLAEARAADRQCRAEIIRARRDRDRLAPGTSARASRRPTAPVPAPPPPPPAAYAPPPEPLAFSEVSPVLIGGIERLQQSIIYPDMEQRARIEGRVIVRFVVGPDGRTTNVEVVRSVSPGLDRAAVQAVERARFEPGKQDGQAVSVRQTLPVTFRIVDNPSPAPYSPPR